MDGITTPDSELMSEYVIPYNTLNEDLAQLVQRLQTAQNDEGENGRFSFLTRIYDKYSELKNKDDVLVLELTEEAYKKMSQIEPKLPFRKETRDANDPSPSKTQYFLDLDPLKGSLPGTGEPDVFTLIKHGSDWQEVGFTSPIGVMRWFPSHFKSIDLATSNILSVKAGSAKLTPQPIHPSATSVNIGTGAPTK